MRENTLPKTVKGAKGNVPVETCLIFQAFARYVTDVKTLSTASYSHKVLGTK